MAPQSLSRPCNSVILITIIILPLTGPLLCTRPSAKSSSDTAAGNPHDQPVLSTSRSCHRPHFRGKETGVLRSHTFLRSTDPSLQSCVYSRIVPFIASSLAGLKLREGRRFGFLSGPVPSAPCRQSIDSYLLNELIKPHNLPKVPPAAAWQSGANNAGRLARGPCHHTIHPAENPCLLPLCSFLQTQETETKMRGDKEGERCAARRQESRLATRPTVPCLRPKLSAAPLNPQTFARAPQITKTIITSSPS